MIIYQASQEQFAPDELLHYALLAEQAGFEGIHSSDHFHPWSSSQGQSAFTFAWMGAVLQATSIPCGMICAPGQRYHPAIVAQAAATLEVMYPGRFWMELGSGEAMNEAITGEGWPSKPERNERLLECNNIIRRLWAGETVSHEGHVLVEKAKLYTRPKKAPLLLGAALSTETAAWMGGWADGLVTTANRPEKAMEIAEAFRQGGGEGKPLYFKLQLSYAHDEQSALMGAYEQWRTNILAPEVIADLRTPEEFEAAARDINPDQIREHVKVSADIVEHVFYIRKFLSAGFDHIILHNVNRLQEQFIRDIGPHIPHIQ